MLTKAGDPRQRLHRGRELGLLPRGAVVSRQISEENRPRCRRRRSSSAFGSCSVAKARAHILAAARDEAGHSHSTVRANDDRAPLPGVAHQLGDHGGRLAQSSVALSPSSHGRAPNPGSPRLFFGLLEGGSRPPARRALGAGRRPLRCRRSREGRCAAAAPRAEGADREEVPGRRSGWYGRGAVRVKRGSAPTCDVITQARLLPARLADSGRHNAVKSVRLSISFTEFADEAR
jgi:hypothetical protein